MSGIELKRRRILIDGAPVLVMAGEIHYFRVPRDQWAGRIDLAVELGCTAIASYIPWLWHELPDGGLDVVGRTRPERDVGAFIDLCADRGLQFIARPGPFIMAELKNEGLPYRLYREHPEIIATGWDAIPVPTATVDYLAPAYLDECRRWFDAVLPVIADRLYPHGPVIALQLDNEIGMLAWVSNSPDLTDGVLTELRNWLRSTSSDDLLRRYPIDASEPADWRRAVESPSEAWAADLRVDLALFMRHRFARYTAALTDMAEANGITGIPLLINIHGTESGNGVRFGVGVSQLLETFAGVPGVIAGSDHYLGDMSSATTTDIHFINAIQAAVNGPDQPLSSLEFEAGTGDYGGGLDQLYDEATVELKTRLCLAQGNRMINYYLLAGGINPPLDEAVGDGNNRISFTGRRHGTAAPIGPEGQRGLTFAATGRAGHAARLHARWLADMDEERDDLAVGFIPDAFATEYRYPPSEVMARVTADLTDHRGPGPRKALWRSLLFAGFRFGAVDLQNPQSVLPAVLGVAGGRHLAESVQQRLVQFALQGGGLIWLGPIPERDLRDRPCRVLADAVGVVGSPPVVGSHRYFPSVRGLGDAAILGETRVGWLQELRLPEPTGGTALLEDVQGRICGMRAPLGTGSVTVLAAELPSHPMLFSGLIRSLGVRPGLELVADVPGVVATTTGSPDGDRLLHLLNPTGYRAQVRVGSGGVSADYVVPAHTGHLLARGLTTPFGRIESATSELTAMDAAGMTFAPSLAPDGHEIRVRTDRHVTAFGAHVRATGDGVVVISAESGSPLTVRTA